LCDSGVHVLVLQFNGMLEFNARTYGEQAAKTSLRAVTEKL
jgi:hypothetical protein